LQGADGDEIVRRRVEVFANKMRPSGFLVRSQLCLVSVTVHVYVGSHQSALRRPGHVRATTMPRTSQSAERTTCRTCKHQDHQMPTLYLHLASNSTANQSRYALHRHSFNILLDLCSFKLSFPILCAPAYIPNDLPFGVLCYCESGCLGISSHALTLFKRPC
jgi:hypothetical protein